MNMFVTEQIKQIKAVIKSVTETLAQPLERWERKEYEQVLKHNQDELDRLKKIVEQYPELFSSETESGEILNFNI